MNNLLILIILFIIIIAFNSYTKKHTETFQNNTTRWSPDLIRRFLEYQSTVNNNVNQFNMEVLQQQATPYEAEEFLKNGHWDWTEELKNLYVEGIWSSPLIKVDPQIALNNAMSIYNQNAAIELLAWNTKEGRFLLYGTDAIKCSNDNNSVLQKNNKNIKLEDIPKEVPGFNFVKSPCNPCAIFHSPRDFTCPFKIRISQEQESDSISKPWKILWGL